MAGVEPETGQPTRVVTPNARGQRRITCCASRRGCRWTRRPRLPCSAPASRPGRAASLEGGPEQVGLWGLGGLGHMAASWPALGAHVSSVSPTSPDNTADAHGSADEVVIAEGRRGGGEGTRAGNSFHRSSTRRPRRIIWTTSSSSGSGRAGSPCLAHRASRTPPLTVSIYPAPGACLAGFADRVRHRGNPEVLYVGSREQASQVHGRSMIFPIRGSTRLRAQC